MPKKSSLKDDSNDTKNETEKGILPFFMIGQSFVKSIGVFPGPWSTSLKKHAVLKELTLAVQHCPSVILRARQLRRV